MKDKIRQLGEEIDRLAAENNEQLEQLRIRFLSKKGLIPALFADFRHVAPEQRKEIGQALNTLKQKAAEKISALKTHLDQEGETASAETDLSRPADEINIGSRHPISLVRNRIVSIFQNIGFNISDGPEMEDDWHNFTALNFPPEHPARDMQDTFFISEDVVLRTHTSPLQIRTMEKQSPPVRIIMPGKVYRCDSDLTHTPMFHQVEGLLVDEDISFGDLKGILTTFIHQIFDEQTRLRFRPSFFPFTEPSAEVDILCVMCRGQGCRVCSHTGWIEILGSGMVHPALYENVGYDADRYTGFAFGMGVERIAMLKYGIDDIRKFFENDMRFLAQL